MFSYYIFLNEKHRVGYSAVTRKNIANTLDKKRILRKSAKEALSGKIDVLFLCSFSIHDLFVIHLCKT